MATTKSLAILIITFTLCSFHINTKNCPADLLYGEWLLIKMYPGKLTQPDTLNAVPKNSPYGIPIMTFEKTGRYKSDEGDYSEDGNYTLDSNNCMISFSSGKLKLEITYIDDSCLLLVRNDKPGHRTFFYKRKTE